VRNPASLGAGEQLVGAVDAIADIVCSVAGLEHLNVERIYVSQFPLGGGTVECEHGIIPVPAPATVELVRDFPARLGPIASELVTPTGAAILTTLAEPCGDLSFRIQKVGYGAGSREHEDLPNVLRLFVGESAKVQETDTVTLIETNIDDMNAEIYPFVIERLLDNGALDAFMIPIIMKKGRPGILLSTLASSEKVERLLDVIYTETTTLGVRLVPVGRRKLKRWQEKRLTSFGEVTIKVAEWQGRRFWSPEFEDCQRLALEKRLPLREVYEQLRQELSSLSS